MSKKKKPLVEVKVQSQTMYEGIGAKGQGPLNLGIKAFKRARRSTLFGRKPSLKHLSVKGSIVRKFKDEAWAKLKKIEVPIIKGNTPHRKGSPYVRTR